MDKDIVKDGSPTARAAGKPRRKFAAVMLLYGGCLAVPGAVLLSLGGSPFYLLTGLAALATAVLLWRGNAVAVSSYAGILAATLIWALWESGLDGWALLPRLGLPILLGLWLLTHKAYRSLRAALIGRAVIAAVSVTGIAVIVIGLIAAPPLASAPALPGLDAGAAPSALAVDGDWLEYGRDKAGTRFAPLVQLTRENVDQLQPAWTYRVGTPKNLRVALEVSPLKVGDRLYLCAGNSDVIALDAESGRQIWRFEAKANPAGIFAGVCRGVAYYRVPDGGGSCTERIVSVTLDRRLLALNARDGSRCREFGDDGEVNLDAGMGDVEPGYYLVTSAPQIVRGKVVFGGWVTDGQYVGEPSGVIRAFDAITGKIAWAWDMGRSDAGSGTGADARGAGPAAGGPYTRGTPNSWAPISADEDLGLVYLPTGNATPDYVGSHRRPFDDAYSSSVVALEAQTGAVRWSFQTTHHDVWDYDVPSQPTLIDLSDGTPALLQATKRGELFLLDRRTGVPLAKVEERAVPATEVPGERSAPTQPFSVDMPSFAGPPPTESRMWGITPFDQLWCRIKFREARYEGTLTPVGIDRPTLVFPGYLGGMNWGSVAVDPERQLAIVNSTQVLNYDQLLSRKAADAMGIKPFSASGHGNVGGPVAQAGTPFAARIAPFLSPLVVPCTEPPYGMISAVDLKTRRLLWSHPFGTAEDSGPLLTHSHLPLTMGVPNIGGAVATRSGLTFIGASQDNYLRAFETATGRELWRTRLPAGGQATPITYWSPESARQFVLIAAGGHGGLQTTPGDYILAYALPKSLAKQ